MSKPNILIILTDQQAYSAMSCAGNNELHTPAMDSLVQRGVLFSRAYCTYPLCTPSRASLFTGRMPHEVGVNANGQHIAPDLRQQELGLLFRRAGYDCVYGGKWHVPEIAMPDEEHGFRNLCGFDDAHLADRCIDYLRHHGDDGESSPFLLVASFDNPHNICEWARSQAPPWGAVPDAPTADCPNLPPNFAIPAYEPDAIRWAQRWEPRPYPTVTYSDDDWRHYRQAYFRLVEKVDGEIGRILQGLRDVGLEENTIVVFTSDHGDGMGAHHWNQKSVMYEEVVRVPMIVSVGSAVAPPPTPTGVVDDRHLVSSGLDLMPTVCDYAGIEPPPDLRGLSLRDLVEGREPASWREQVVVEGVLSHAHKMSARMVRTQRHKYVVYSYGRYREQLMDLDADPGEMVNLAVESRHADTLAEHRQRLWRWCQDTDDRFEEHGSHPGRAMVPGHEYDD
jgi:arylsulfatase A-like enzyme